jgi:hypothetical protein
MAKAKQPTAPKRQALTQEQVQLQVLQMEHNSKAKRLGEIELSITVLQAEKQNLLKQLLQLSANAEVLKKQQAPSDQPAN